MLGCDTEAVTGASGSAAHSRQWIPASWREIVACCSGNEVDDRIDFLRSVRKFRPSS